MSKSNTGKQVNRKQRKREPPVDGYIAAQRRSLPFRVEQQIITRQENVEETEAMDKAQNIGWAQTLTIIGVLGALIIGVLSFSHSGLESRLTGKIDGVETRLTARIDSVETRLTARIDSVETSLTARIDSVETKFDNKFNNLADMMIVAHTNGNVTEAELVEIWGRVKEPE